MNPISCPEVTAGGKLFGAVCRLCPVPALAGVILKHIAAVVVVVSSFAFKPVHRAEDFHSCGIGKNKLLLSFVRAITQVIAAAAFFDIGQAVEQVGSVVNLYRIDQAATDKAENVVVSKSAVIIPTYHSKANGGFFFNCKHGRNSNLTGEPVFYFVIIRYHNIVNPSIEKYKFYHSKMNKIIALVLCTLYNIYRLSAVRV